MSFTHYNAMKPLLLIISLLSSFAVDASTEASRFCVQNDSARNFNITGVDVDSYDWQDVHDDGAMNRPDHKFDNYTLNTGDTHCVALDFNNLALSHGFALQVLPSPGNSKASGTKTRIYLHCNQRYDDNECIQFEWRIEESASSPSSTSGRLHGVSLRCPDPKMEYYEKCRLFKITH